MVFALPLIIALIVIGLFLLFIITGILINFVFTILLNPFIVVVLTILLGILAFRFTKSLLGKKRRPTRLFRRKIDCRLKKNKSLRMCKDGK